MSKYSVIMTDGNHIQMPRDKARSNKYENIAEYGLQAVLERVMRTRAYRKAQAADIHIRAIVCPDGTEVTQF